MVVCKISLLFYCVLGIFLLLIISNCVVLGVVLFIVKKGIDSFMDVFLYGFGVVLGFLLVLVLFVVMCECIVVVDVFLFFKGVFIGLVIVGFMLMVFMGFFGLIKI